MSAGAEENSECITAQAQGKPNTAYDESRRDHSSVSPCLHDISLSRHVIKRRVYVIAATLLIAPICAFVLIYSLFPILNRLYIAASLVIKLSSSLLNSLRNMVNPSYVGSLASHALLYLSGHPTERADKAAYTTNTIDSISSIQKWYNRTTGLWETTEWWNGAVVLTMLADFAALEPTQANVLNLGDVFFNTYNQAQKVVVNVTKAVDSTTGLVRSSCVVTASNDGVPDANLTDGVEARTYPHFLNYYYDDEGWWALALIRLYDTTHYEPYIVSAGAIFDDMRNTGVDDVCKGGIWWSRRGDYKNAIANSLYMAVAASLANRAKYLPWTTGVPPSPNNNASAGGDTRSYYLGIADVEWEWYRSSEMINATTGLVNDGLMILNTGECVNNGGEVWSYNQGALIFALAELSAARGGDTELLEVACGIAEKAMEHLQEDGKGILREPCEPSCGPDGAQFKGVFMRGLERLWRETGKQGELSQEVKSEFEEKRKKWREYVLRNADSVWENARFSNGSFNLVWGGPKEAGDGPNAGTSSSAMEALVAAMGVA